MMGITARLFERMGETANESALEIDGRVITYGELIEKAMLVATGLIENGAARETDINNNRPVSYTHLTLPTNREV